MEPNEAEPQAEGDNSDPAERGEGEGQDSNVEGGDNAGQFTLSSFTEEYLV